MTDPLPPTAPTDFVPKKPPQLLYIFGALAIILVTLAIGLSFLGKAKTTTTDKTRSDSDMVVGNVDFPKYTNSKYFYELALPKKWVEIQHSPLLSNIAIFDVEGTATLEITAGKVVPSLDEFLSSQDLANPTTIKSTKSIQVRVGDYDALERSESWPAVGLQVITTYVKVQDMLYTFALIPGGGKNAITNESVIRDYHTALASFRLTDTTQLGLDLKEYVSQKVEGLTYPAFSLKYPQSWVATEEFVGKDTLIVSVYRNNYEIRITQAPVGGAVCLFKDSPDFQGSSGDLRSKEYSELTTTDGIIMRRYFNKNEGDKSTIFFCRKEKDSPYFSTPTDIGGIAYYVPAKYDPDIIKEMDEIVKSIQAL